MAESELFDQAPPGFWQRIQYPLRWLAIAGLIAGAVYAFKRYELVQYIDQKSLQELIVPLGPAAPVAFIALFVLAMLLMVIPYSLMAGLGVLLFGMAWGMLWTVLGGTTAAMAVWGISRLFGQRILAKKQDDPRWKNLNERLRKDGFYYLLLVRALSIVPFNILNFACAFTSIRVRDFLLANLIGLIPSAFVYGYGLKLLLDPATPKGLLAGFVGVIALLLVTPLVFRQARKHRRTAQRKRIAEAFEHPE
ncbi:MAG: TVP38/TMEM64 family protein [Candidatus Sericytochromatia bacterium]